VSLFEHLRRVELLSGPFLVVVPLGTISHWKKEFENWTDFNCVTYHDAVRGKETRRLIRETEFYYGTTKVRPTARCPDRRRGQLSQTFFCFTFSHFFSASCRFPSLLVSQTIKFNVMLTTYEVLISDVEELSNVGWLQVIVDEGHRIKNKSSKILEALQMINCNRRLLLTGTPVRGKNKRDTRSDRTEPAHAAVARVLTD